MVEYLYTIIGIISAALFIILVYMMFEARWLKIEKIIFNSKNDAIRIAHISDIHINRLKISRAIIRKNIIQSNPDIILLSGDFIEKPSDCEPFLNLARECFAGFKTFAVFGNHDYKAFLEQGKSFHQFEKLIENIGIKILHNKCQTLKIKNRTLNIIGVEDMSRGLKNLYLVKNMLNNCSESSTTVVFTHNPDIILELQEKNINYFFAGHFHGGQIWLPFKAEFKILRKEKLCRMGITKGLHKLGNTLLYINRGIGNVVVPLRFLSRPEITIVDL